MATARDSFGTVLQVDVSGTFTSVGNLTSVGFLDASYEDIDTTTMDTTGGKAFLPSALYDGGTISCTVLYDPDDSRHEALKTSFDARTTESWKIQLSDTTDTITFSGYVKSMSGTAEVDGALSMSFSIKVTGGVTITDS
tara:strand:+ start:30 stop:446 length:417 start_codon:yes stop_codon:yes gene_type:complete